jgi:hypothetical protein
LYPVVLELPERFYLLFEAGAFRLLIEFAITTTILWLYVLLLTEEFWLPILGI